MLYSLEHIVTKASHVLLLGYLRVFFLTHLDVTTHIDPSVEDTVVPFYTDNMVLFSIPTLSWHNTNPYHGTGNDVNTCVLHDSYFGTVHTSIKTIAKWLCCNCADKATHIFSWGNKTPWQPPAQRHSDTKNSLFLTHVFHICVIQMSSYAYIDKRKHCIYRLWYRVLEKIPL